MRNVFGGADQRVPHGTTAGPIASDAPLATAAAPAGIRVVVVDDRAMVRTGLCFVVASRPGLTVVAESGLADAVATITQHRPDVLVLALPETTTTALAVIREVTLACPATAVLLLTSASPRLVDERALELGVRGILALELPAATLVKAIEKVHAGELWLDRARTAGLLQSVARAQRDPEQAKIATLTRRELEIVRLVGEGLRNAQVAERLFISQATVRNHVTSILDKLDLEDRFDLAVYAFRHGIVRYP